MKRLIITIIILFLGVQTAHAVFSDITSNHPNFDAIMYLKDEGIIEGYEDYTFRPSKEVNRAEALKIILLGSKVIVPDIQEQEVFPDVMSGTWYGKFAAKAKNLKIVSGDASTGHFRPGDTVNLAEALKILLKTNNIDSPAASSAPYADVSPEAWFAPYFVQAKNYGLLDESERGDVHPDASITRGRLAELMYRLMTKPKGYKEGQASYYGEKFHGRTTASGEVFDASKFTAAHKELPFNTWLQVTNLENNKSVNVRISDRGPYVGDRVIDLSKAAFESIASISRGVINVSFHPISEPKDQDSPVAENVETNEESATLSNELPTSCPTETTVHFLPTNSFENINLDSEIPNRVLENEMLHITGTTLNNTDVVTAFIMDEDKGQIAYYDTVEDGKFELNVWFPGSGRFQLGIVPSNSGSSLIRDINVLDGKCIKESEKADFTKISNLETTLRDGDFIVSWNKGEYEWFRVTFKDSKGKSNIFYTKESSFVPNYPDFEDYKNGYITIGVHGTNIESNSLLVEDTVNWSLATTKKIKATTHHNYTIKNESVNVIKLPSRVNIREAMKVSFEAKTTVNAKAAIIMPDGSVEEIDLVRVGTKPIKNQNDINIYPPSDKNLTFSFNPQTNATHFLEINNADGLAVINIPVYASSEYPLIPNIEEISDKSTQDLSGNVTTLRNEMLSAVNTDRNEHNLSDVKIDGKLNQLAQFRADDMTSKKYFSHWDNEGNSANTLRKDYAINPLVGENIARDVSIELVEYSLMRSAVHRANILSDEWTRAGFGISKNSDGSYIFVQIFSTEPVDIHNEADLRRQMFESVNSERSTNLAFSDTLNTVAQNWSDDMVERDYFDFNTPTGETLIDKTRNEGVTASIGTYLMGDGSFSSALSKITENESLKETRWKNIGIGIKQDQFGVIKITLVYTE